MMTGDHHASVGTSAFLVGCLLAAGSAAGDIAGSHDHPMVSRFPEATIVGYEHKFHDLAWLPDAPVANKNEAQGEWLAGRLTWIVYEAPATRSTLEIYRNYEKALKDAGFTAGFACAKKDCGRHFVQQMLGVTGRTLPRGERWIPGTERYLNARLDREQGHVWLSMLLFERDREGTPVIRFEIVEENAPRQVESLGGEAVDRKTVKYDEVKLAAGPTSRGKLDTVLELEGAIDWQAYRYSDQVSAYEAMASQRSAWTSEAYQTVFQCHLESCGNHFIERVVELNGNIIPGGERWQRESAHYLLARRVGAGQLAYRSVLAYGQPDGKAVARILSVVPEEMQFDLVKVDGQALADEMDRSGRVAVYGIYFDTDSAEIKPESEEALAQIARLMELRPGLKIYVDGHTDDVGADEYNQALSEKRATAVVQALAAKYAVAPERLQARGLGESQPVAPNDSDEARAWNRRVELVERPPEGS